MRQQPARLIVGISGASGVVYGVRLLELLREARVETHLVMTRAAELTLSLETRLKVRDVEKLADVVHEDDDLRASIASGSFRTLGMIVAPCSVKTLSAVATGTTGSLIARAADVVLKERRRLVLMVREAPLHLLHLRSMAAATEAGAIIFPPLPAFYAGPRSIAQMVDQTLGRVLDLFDLDVGTLQRWAPPPRKRR